METRYSIQITCHFIIKCIQLSRNSVCMVGSSLCIFREGSSRLRKVKSLLIVLPPRSFMSIRFELRCLLLIELSKANLLICCTTLLMLYLMW